MHIWIGKLPRETDCEMLVVVKKSNLQCALKRCPLDVLKLAGLLPQNLKTNPFHSTAKITKHQSLLRNWCGNTRRGQVDRRATDRRGTPASLLISHNISRNKKPWKTQQRCVAKGPAPSTPLRSLFSHPPQSSNHHNFLQMERYQFGCKLTLNFDCTRKLRRKKSWSTVRWLDAEAGNYRWNNASGTRNNREYRVIMQPRTFTSGRITNARTCSSWMISSTETHLEMGNRGSLFYGALRPFPSLCVFSNVLVSAVLYVVLRCTEREREETTSSSQENLQMCWFFFLKSVRFVFSRMVGCSASQRRWCVEFSSRTWGLFPVRWSRVLLCRQRRSSFWRDILWDFFSSRIRGFFSIAWWSGFVAL